MYDDFDIPGADEVYTILDEANLAAYDQDLLTALSRMSHANFWGTTKHFYCHYQTNQHQFILDRWKKSWKSFDRLAPEEQEPQIKDGQLFMYVLYLYVKRHGLGTLLAELQKFHQEFDEDDFFGYEDEEEEEEEEE